MRPRLGLMFGLELWGALLLGAALSSHALFACPLISRFGLAGRRPIVAATGGTLLAAQKSTSEGSVVKTKGE